MTGLTADQPVIRVPDCVAEWDQPGLYMAVACRASGKYDSAVWFYDVDGDVREVSTAATEGGHWLEKNAIAQAIAVLLTAYTTSPAERADTLDRARALGEQLEERGRSLARKGQPV